MDTCSTHMGVHKWNTNLRTPLCCAVHHLVCTVQPMGHTETGQVFIFAQEG